MDDTMQSEFLTYLAGLNAPPGQRLPPIKKIAAKLGISRSKLREQLEVARILGFVEVRPKTGTRTQAFSLLPTLITGLQFGMEADNGLFDSLGMLRNHLEAGFWHEAVRLLHDEDKERLQELVDRAWQRLKSTPIQIPHSEHRQLHLTVYSRLDNPILQAVLEAYWFFYERIGYKRYSDYDYLHRVWEYHEKMVDAIITGDYESGYQALVQHIGLLQQSLEMDNYQPAIESGAEIDSFVGTMGVTPYE
jgi:DNA-binding FadR family transcriptional regulator